MQQASLKIRLYTQKTYADGTHPVVLQYIINRKVKRKVLTNCREEDWDFKTNRIKNRANNSARINHFINSEFVKAEHDLYDVKSGEVAASELFGNKKSLTLGEAIDLELQRFTKEVKSGYYDQFSAIKKQLPDLNIKLSDINGKWFNSIIAHLASLGNTSSTIKGKVKKLKSLLTRHHLEGISKDIREVTVKTVKPTKQKLSAAEFQSLIDLNLPEDDLIAATRDIFVLQVYLRGIRIGDLLQASSKDFDNGKFSYTADKTDKSQSIKLIPKAQEIVDRYKGKYDRLFPFFTWVPDKKLSKFDNERARLKHKESCTTIVNKYLKLLGKMAGITKPLSSHIARHTFARMAIDKINNPMITMELLGHSSLAVHQQYLNDIRKDDVLDAAADDIFS